MELFFKLKSIEMMIGWICGGIFLIIFLVYALYSFWKDIVYPIWVRDWIKKAKEAISKWRN